MPNNGFFFDSIIRQKPIVEEELDPADNLEEFGPISDAELDYYRRAAAELKSSSRGICANFGGTGLGDIALVPGPFMKHPKGIRDVTEWYISTVSRRDYLHEVFSKQTDTALENLAKIRDAAGDLPDAMFICGTDFGTQTSTFCSIDTYRDLYKPYYQKVTDWIHANTGWKVFKHSCGSVIDFVEEFIESGFDILNPVQLSAAGMDPVDLKKRFGGRIVFWGGGVDTQKTLPFGKPEEVREEVLRRCEIFAPGGGYVFNAIHNVQAKSPVENVAAMIEAVHEFNGEK
jgi:uroporphyrinogen-III decarboxylase